ncbi:RsmB/NOP family class I SAM-dependent RNA methyltransferase [Marivivens sp. JLT3646]|uniref:RsmB/NOP family class I SAM-dependent RNA methyltransferase n=1 Tax=Marivivens sp. JLT3646 TaxID=1920883 RepID=UPI00080223AA|nr:transcription antitermination factor NusB [Marivivens sp. JLT3646]APO85575.1 16S rRNA methyltransferase [Marivivens sp. JLT3646]OBR35509.1 16S rRNA methyltransferase [Donghicola sp. JL3646]
MTQTGIAPRLAAHRLLNAVTEDGRLLSEVTAHHLAKLEPEDRARAQRLVVDTLRGLGRVDRVLKPHLRKMPPLSVQNALRLASFELLTGAAGHGVVNAYVEIVGRDRKTVGLKGLVNAVLRKVAAEGSDNWGKLPVPQLPKWLRVPLIEAWGNKAVMAMEHVQMRGAPLDITVKTDPEAVATALGGEVLPTGSVRLSDGGQVSALAGFDAGDWWVQDAAAAIPVKVLAPKAGETILDLCAAPGGKTMQLAAAGAEVTALDVSESRMARVQENLTRTGLTAKIVVADAFAFDEGGFDAVLLDAPCSATGTIRRHPDLPHAKNGSEFGALIDQQVGLIDHALSLVKPGGRLVYCTCSLLPDEGEVQIEELLERHPDLTIDRDALLIDGVDPEWITEEGGLRLRPDYWADKGGMDGFYLAVVRKPA